MVKMQKKQVKCKTIRAQCTMGPKSTICLFTIALLHTVSVN